MDELGMGLRYFAFNFVVLSLLVENNNVFLLVILAPHSIRRGIRWGGGGGGGGQLSPLHYKMTLLYFQLFCDAGRYERESPTKQAGGGDGLSQAFSFQHGHIRGVYPIMLTQKLSLIDLEKATCNFCI